MQKLWILNNIPCLALVKYCVENRFTKQKMMDTLKEFWCGKIRDPMITILVENEKKKLGKFWIKNTKSISI